MVLMENCTRNTYLFLNTALPWNEVSKAEVQVYVEIDCVSEDTKLYFYHSNRINLEGAFMWIMQLGTTAEDVHCCMQLYIMLYEPCS